MKKLIKEYCKLGKLKFERLTVDGFIASRLMDVRAGMEYNPISGKILSMEIKKIGSKRVYRKFKIHSDSDITDNGLLDFTGKLTVLYTKKQLGSMLDSLEELSDYQNERSVLPSNDVEDFAVDVMYMLRNFGLHTESQYLEYINSNLI